MYSYKFRLQPTRLQSILLNKHFGSIRFIYNHFLSQRIKEYQDNNKSLNYYDNARDLTQLKKQDDTGWLKEINSQSLQYSLRSLDLAFDGFFKKRSGFPKFHSKYHRQSFRVPQNTKVVDGKLHIPKFKQGIKVIEHREIQGEIKFSTISKDPDGKYYVSITVERDIQEYKVNDKIVGIDMGIKSLLVCSDGTEYGNSKNTYKYQAKLKRLQQLLSRKVKGSSNRNKRRLKVSKLHKTIQNKRKDAIQKATTDIVKKNQVIIIESLRPKNMVKNHKLAKAVSDASFGEIKRQLEYKAKWYGRVVVKIDPFYPSSKTCNNCGWINKNLTLKDREWDCSQCANKNINRDKNASLNIRDEGLRCISAGTVDYTCGENVSLDLIKQISMKQEASMALA